MTSAVGERRGPAVPVAEMTGSRWDWGRRVVQSASRNKRTGQTPTFIHYIIRLYIIHDWTFTILHRFFLRTRQVDGHSVGERSAE